MPDATDVAARLASAASDAEASAVPGLLNEVDALLAAHQDRVYAMCFRMLGHPERAAEVAQDVMLRAFQKLPGFRGDSRFSTWILSIARYECLNHLRKRGEILTLDGVIEVEDPQRSVLSSLRLQEREALLRDSAAAVLTDSEQEAVLLRYTEHLPIDEITRLLAIPETSGARGVLQRCKRKLRRELRRRLDEMGHTSSFVRGSLD